MPGIDEYDPSAEEFFNMTYTNEVNPDDPSNTDLSSNSLSSNSLSSNSLSA